MVGGSWRLASEGKAGEAVGGHPPSSQICLLICLQSLFQEESSVLGAVKEEKEVGIG